MVILSNPAIPKDSVVLVTGVNGLVANRVGDPFLKFGYKFRGTSREISRDAWMTTIFEEKYGSGRFELVQLADLGDDGAYDGIIKGIAAVLHVAAVANIGKASQINPLLANVEATMNVLNAAYAEPSVKRFIFTSSAAASAIPELGEDNVTVTRGRFSELTLQEVRRTDVAESMHRNVIVYAASKVLSEQAVWNYSRTHAERRPDMVVNTVLPNVVLGNSIDPVGHPFASSTRIVPGLWARSDHPFLAVLRPQYFIHTEDVGLLHVAAAIHPDVKGERIFGSAEKFSIDTLLGILRSQNSGRQFMTDFNGGHTNNIIEGRDRAEQLLQDLGAPGWTPLEESVRMNSELLKSTPS